MQVALRDLAADLGDSTVVMADLCLCEYTDHGHCGPLDAAGSVDNDRTLARYASVAVAQARAGAHVIAPSGMQDGQVAAIRAGLDAAGFADVPVLAYAAKYASAYYGPFREAAESTPATGDRRAYQMDPANAVEALREVSLDLAEGADAVMVKPAGPYLDVLRQVRDAVDVPVFAYQVSGEYSMLEAAAAQGWVDRERAILESLRRHPPRRGRRGAHLLGHRGGPPPRGPVALAGGQEAQGGGVLAAVGVAGVPAGRAAALRARRLAGTRVAHLHVDRSPPR